MITNPMIKIPSVEPITEASPLGMGGGVVCRVCGSGLVLGADSTG